MKRIATSLTVALSLAVVAVSTARADHLDDVELGIPVYGGTGCPGGSIAAVLSTDKQKLSVLFDEFYAETEPGKRWSRSGCSLAVPLHLPHGVSVSVYRIDYRGFASIPAAGLGRFAVEYFFAGQAGPVLTRYFLPGFLNDFLITDDIELPYVVWSACGEDTIARINANLYARKASAWAAEEAMLAVDSTDIDAEIEFHLVWKTCTE